MIVCNHLMEHLPVDTVPNLLESIKSHMHEESVFWFTTPSFCPQFFNDPTHIRPYNKVAMEKLFAMTEYTFSLVNEGYYFHYPVRWFKFPKFRITYGYARR